MHSPEHTVMDVVWGTGARDLSHIATIGSWFPAEGREGIRRGGGARRGRWHGGRGCSAGSSEGPGDPGLPVLSGDGT